MGHVECGGELLAPALWKRYELLLGGSDLSGAIGAHLDIPERWANHMEKAL